MMSFCKVFHFVVCVGALLYEQWSRSIGLQMIKRGRIRTICHPAVFDMDNDVQERLACIAARLLQACCRLESKAVSIVLHYGAI